MITLRFVYHPSIFSWLCSRLAQGDFQYTHVEFLRPSDGYYIGAMGDGVKARPPNYDAGEFTKELFVHMVCTDDMAEKFEGFVGSQIGKPYDYWAVLSFFWPSRDWQEYDHWDCSELMGTGFGEIEFLPREFAVKFSRLTVLGAYEMAIMRAG